MRNRDGLQYFWILLGCCTMSAASMGICIYPSGVFFQAVSLGLDISLGAISFTTTLSMIAMALTTIFLPHLFRVLPYRWILTASASLALGGVFGMSFCFNTFWLDLFSICKGIGAAGFGLVPVTYIINNWFQARRDLIIGLAAASSAAAGALMVFILGASVEGLGWRMGYVIQAILLGILLLPPFLLPFSLDPKGLGLSPYGQNVSRKRRSLERKKTSLLYLAIIAILVSFVSASPQYFSSYAGFLGQSALLGASVYSYAMIGNFVFKIVGGFFADQTSSLYTSLALGAITLFADLGMALCEFSFSSFTILSMAFLFGASYGLGELCLPILVSALFPRKSYIRIYSLVNAFSIFTGALAIVMIGMGIDLFGSYSWIWLLNGLLLAITLYLLWRLSDHSFETGLKIRPKKPLEGNEKVISDSMPAGQEEELEVVETESIE